jgi:DNA-binding response OmpR family regulator
MEALLYSPSRDETAILASIIQQAGLFVKTTHNLDQTIESWADHPSDLILLSFFGNYQQAIQQIGQLRALSVVPILVLVDLLAEDILVNFYTVGADLVITRPYSPLLLLHIIHAQLRHNNTISFYSLPSLVKSGVTLDPSIRAVTVSPGKPKHLTQLEFRLLYSLMIHAGQIIPTDKIIEEVWGYHDEASRDLVRGLVQRVRAKIEDDPQKPRYILTEPGLGYYFQQSENGSL